MPPVGSRLAAKSLYLVKTFKARVFPVRRLVAELHTDDFKNSAPQRYAIFDDVYLAGEKLIDHCSGRFGWRLRIRLGLPALPFLPFRVFGRSAITNVVFVSTGCSCTRTPAQECPRDVASFAAIGRATGLGRSSRALPGLGLIAATAIHCVATTMRSLLTYRGQARASTSVGYGLRLVRELRPSSSHTDRIAALCGASLLIRRSGRLCRFRGSRHHREDSPAGYPPAGLMAECTAEHRSGAAATLPAACLVHRGSVVRDAQSLCSPGSDTGERKRCGLAQFPRRVSN